MKAYLAFTPYYHEMPNWYNIGKFVLIDFQEYLTTALRLILPARRRKEQIPVHLYLE